MEELISIIVPVYKVEAYLPPCIDSLLSQTYRNLEIILVDDGSPDGCGAICDDYAVKDQRIKVIHKQNEGVAKARNDGLATAQGTYISFVDSDDFLAPDAYEVLYQGLLEYKADCAVGRCVTMIEQGGRLVRKEEPIKPVYCQESDEAMRHVLLHGSAIWNRLFHRRIFESLRFPIGRINDDEVVALHAYALCERIVFLNKDSYYYRIRRNSITTSKFSRRSLDVYYNSVDNLAFVKEERPSLTECAQFKVYKALLYCYLHLRDLKKEPDYDELKLTFRAKLKQSRSDILRNPYTDAQMKLALFATKFF